MFFEIKRSSAATFIAALLLLITPGCGGGGGGGGGAATTPTTGTGGSGGSGGSGSGGTSEPFKIDDTNPATVTSGGTLRSGTTIDIDAISGQVLTFEVNLDAGTRTFDGEFDISKADATTGIMISEAPTFAAGNYTEVTPASNQLLAYDFDTGNKTVSLTMPTTATKITYLAYVVFNDLSTNPERPQGYNFRIHLNGGSGSTNPGPTPMPNIDDMVPDHFFVGSGARSSIQITASNPTTNTVKVKVVQLFSQPDQTVQVNFVFPEQDLAPGLNQTLNFPYSVPRSNSEHDQTLGFIVEIDGVIQQNILPRGVAYNSFSITSIDNAGRPIIANLSNQIVRINGNSGGDYLYGSFDDTLTYEHIVEVVSMNSNFRANAEYLSNFVPTSNSATAQEFASIGLPVLPADDYVISYTVERKNGNPLLRDIVAEASSSVFTVVEPGDVTFTYNVRDTSVPFGQNSGEVKSLRVINTQGVISLSNPIQTLQPSNGHTNFRQTISDSRHDVLWEPRQYFNLEAAVALTTSVSNTSAAQTGIKFLGANTGIDEIISNRNGDRTAVLYKDITNNVYKITLFGNNLVQNGQDLEPEQFGTVSLNIPNFVLGDAHTKMVVVPMVGAELTEEILIFSKNDGFGYRVPIQNGAISNQTLITLDLGFQVSLCEKSPYLEHGDTVVYVSGSPVGSPSRREINRLTFSVDNLGNTNFTLSSQGLYDNTTQGDISKLIIKYDFAERRIFIVSVAYGPDQYLLPSGPNRQQPISETMIDPFDSSVLRFNFIKAVELPGDTVCAILMKATDSQGNVHNRVVRIDSNNDMTRTSVDYTGVEVHDIIAGRTHFAILGDRDNAQNVQESFVDIEVISQNITSSRLSISDLITDGSAGSYAKFD